MSKDYNCYDPNDAVLLPEAAPWLELEFWDSLAEAFMRYFGQAITLQVIVHLRRRPSGWTNTH